MEKVVIQGLGFVGSAMAVAASSRLDSSGDPIFKVIGIDLPSVDGKKRIDKINSSNFPFEINDKKMDVELKNAVERGNLKASSKTSYYSTADIVIVSINCDLILEDNSSKVALEPFIESIIQIARKISESTLVIIESTVPPGTCEKIVYPVFKKEFLKRNLNIDNFSLAHSYERVMPGKNYFDSIINYWRVYAGIDKKSADRCERFLSKIINIKDYPLSRLKNTISSECGKVLENSYRAVNIAFMEEWGRFAEDANIDIYEIVKSIRLRPTHQNIRQPGFGVGGYCLTKDPLFAKIASKDILKLKNHNFSFSSLAIDINKKMPIVSLNKIKNYFNGDLKSKRIMLLGVSYKQNVGDTRCSPSELFYKEAIKYKAYIQAYDPFVFYWEELRINLAKSIPDPDNFDVILFAVPHDEFKNIEISKWIINKTTLIFDANNVLTKDQIKDVKENNYNLISIGKG